MLTDKTASTTDQLIEISATRVEVEMVAFTPVEYPEGKNHLPGDVFKVNSLDDLKTLVDAGAARLSRVL